MAIKGILFDAADVFYRRPLSTQKYALDLLNDQGVAIDLAAQDQPRHMDLRSLAMRGQISPDEYWDQFLLLHGLAGPEARKTLVGKINDYSDHILAIPGGREVLACLKQRGFVLGIVTDTMYPLERKMRWLAMVGVAEFIDVVACSTALGIQKPDPDIYLDAIRQANLTIVKSAFVGHDAGEIKGAKKVGLKTVAVMYDPHAQADYYAETLPDLLDVPIFQVW